MDCQACREGSPHLYTDGCRACDARRDRDHRAGLVQILSDPVEARIGVRAPRPLPKAAPRGLPRPIRDTIRTSRNAVDLFAGGGGASLGIARATGRSPVLAVNHNPDAIAMHRANHPETSHEVQDIAAVSPARWTRKKIGILWASPDCFPAGTLVLTSSGYTPIEGVRPGALVLTHLGRWRPVTSAMVSFRPTLEIRGHGHPGLRVSAEHPFWTRERLPNRGYTSPAWVRAGALEKGHLWATPLRAEALPVPAVSGRHLDDDERLWWLVGRYLADGWTRETETRSELVITCGDHKAEETRAMLARWPRAGDRAADNEIGWTRRQTRTATQFSTSHRGLVAWLREHFGHLAHAKRIPGWVLGLSEEKRRALLNGYIAGDGYCKNGVIEASTVSKALAFGVYSLAASLGYVPTVYNGNKPGQGNIEGRTVNIRASFAVKWREKLQRDQHFADPDMLWTPIREVKSASEGEEVYNLSVEEDESYVADGRVVHNCTHFSRAKGGKPRSKDIRGLAWSILPWVEALAPRVVFLENVPEFLTWGPLGADGQPDKARAGEDFRAFVAAFRLMGYAVDWRVLSAADYGAPTSRRRLYLIARRDAPPAWPAPSHGPGCPLPWRTAASVIDWSLPCPSIFERERPLADATLRRIAAGVVRYVLQNPRPFVLCLTHGGRLEAVDEPLRTTTTSNRGERAVVVPQLRPQVAAFIAKHYTGATGAALGEPVPTVTATDHNALVTARLTPPEGSPLDTRPPDDPTDDGPSDGRPALAAHITKFYGTATGAPIGAPVPTVTGGGEHLGIVAASLVSHYGASKGRSVTDPVPTITAGGMGYQSLVASFLTVYYSGGGTAARADAPAPTIVSKDRLGLVTVRIDGAEYVLSDIGMRMLQPRELARAQGFPDGYLLTGTKSSQVARIGNSVCPPVAEALVRANL